MGIRRGALAANMAAGGRVRLVAAPSLSALSAGPGRPLRPPAADHGRIAPMAEDTQGTDTPTTAPINVPDKPALEGLEAALTQRWREQGTYAFDPDTTREQVYSIDTPPPTASRVAARRPRVLATPTPTPSPATSACAARTSSTRWAGTTTACPPSAACRTTTACAATRRSPYDAGFQPPAEAGQEPARVADLRAATSSNCASGSTVEDEKVFEDLFRRLGLSVDWSLTYTTIDDESRAHRASARSCATCRAARRTWPRRPTLWDVTSARPSPRPSSRTASAPARTTATPFFTAPTARRLHRDHPARAAGRLRRPRRAPRRRALPAAVRHDGHHAALRRRGAGAWPTTWPSRTRAPASP